jgi:hypothetical protein
MCGILFFGCGLAGGTRQVELGLSIGELFAGVFLNKKWYSGFKPLSCGKNII